MPDNENDEQRISEPASIESPESAESAPDELPDLADALRAAAAKPEAASNDDDQDDDDEDESDAPEQSPEEGSKPDAAPAADTPRPTRAERRRQELEALRAELQQHKGRADFYESEKQKLAQEVQELLSEPEWVRLVQKRLDPNQVLTYDEEQRYAELTIEQDRGRKYLAQAREGIRINNELRVCEVAAKHGLDAAELAPLAADAGELLDKAISATEARVRREKDDEIARLQAERDSALLKRGARAQDPGAGGRSGGTRRHDDIDWDTASPADYFAAGARQRNGRST